MIASLSTSLVHRMRSGIGALATFVLFFTMFAIYAAFEPSALSLLGIGNLINNTVVLAIAAIGLTLVVLCGELDLSGPGVIAITNVVVATTSAERLGVGGSVVAVLIVGAIVGFINGFMVAYLNLQSLAVSLGTLIACQGIALLILPAPGGEVVDSIVNTLTGDFYGVPSSAIVLGFAGLLWLIVKQSRMGIWLYAVGSDRVAANLSGIDVRATKIFAFVAAGLCYAMSGFIYCAEIGSGDPRISDSFLLFMYAAVAIGGASLTGGRGGVFGTLAGAGVLTVLQKMLFALGVADFYTNIFNGIIMISAIFFGRLSTRLGQVQSLRKA